MATQVNEGTKESDKIIKDLDEAVGEWDEYVKSGEFLRTLNMRYENSLKLEANDILMDYQSAYLGIKEDWIGGKKEKKGAISEAKHIIKRNDVRVSEVQSKIIKKREEL